MCLCKSVLEYQQDPVTLHVSPTSPFSPPLSAEKKPINKHYERLCRKLHTTLPSTPFSWQFSERLYLTAKTLQQDLAISHRQNFHAYLKQSTECFYLQCLVQKSAMTCSQRAQTTHCDRSHMGLLESANKCLPSETHCHVRRPRANLENRKSLPVPLQSSL